MVRLPLNLTLLAMGAALAGGCGLSQNSTGPLLTPAAVEAIEPGRTTREDVLELLGPPDEIIYSNLEHDRLQERAFRYRRTVTRRTLFFLVIFGTYRNDSKIDHLVVFFDERGVVSELGARFDGDKASYGFPTVRREEPEEPEEG